MILQLRCRVESVRNPHGTNLGVGVLLLRSHSKCYSLSHVSGILCTPPLSITFRYHPHAHGDGSRKRPVLIVLHVFHAELRSRPPGLLAPHSHFYHITLSLFYCSYKYGLTPTPVLIRAKCMASDKSPIQRELQEWPVYSVIRTFFALNSSL